MSGSQALRQTDRAADQQLASTTYMTLTSHGKPLTDQADEWLVGHAAKYREEFAKCLQLVQASQALLQSVAVDRGNAREVLLVSLFVRLLQLYEGVILLEQFGVGSASLAVLRVQLETAFTLGAVGRDADVMRRYVAQDHLRRLRFFRALEHTSASVLASLDLNRAIELKSDLERRVQEERVRPLSTEELARLADMQDWYDVAYRLLSGPVHSTIRDILQGHLIISEGVIEKIRSGPSDGNTHFAITTGSNLVILSAERLLAALGKGQGQSVLDLKPYFLQLAQLQRQRTST